MRFSLKSISLRILWYINLFFVILLIFTYTAPYISPATLSLPAFLALGYPFLLLVNICWVGFWLYRRSRAIYASFLAIAIGAMNIPYIFGFGGSEKVNPAGFFRLMSYNVRYFNVTESKKETDWIKNQDKILNYIAQQQPTILFGQEFSGKGNASITRATEKLAKMGLLYEHRGGESSLAIYSRYLLENRGVINFEGSFNGAVHADVVLPGNKTVRLYCVHLQSTRLGADANELLKKDNITTINKKETQEKYYRIESKLSSAFAMRAAQAQVLAAHIAQSPYPVIVCGDFNDTPLSYSYRLMSKGLQDSFVKKGLGIGATYAGRLPSLRIDYILVDKNFEVYSHQVQRNAISDHYAVMSDVGIK